MSSLDQLCFYMTSSLCSPLDSHVHNQYSMLDSQTLSWNNFKSQAKLPIYLPNKKEIYVRTCHPALICDKMFISFSKSSISYSDIQS